MICTPRQIITATHSVRTTPPSSVMVFLVALMLSGEPRPTESPTIPTGPTMAAPYAHHRTATNMFEVTL